MDAEEIAALKARKSAILAELVAFGAAAAAAIRQKPSYNVDGQQFDWNGMRVSVTAYRKGLLDELQQIKELLVLAEGDWEVETVIR